MSAVEDIKAASSELLTAPPAKALLRFALPLMAGGACQQIYALTDAAVVGRVLGVNALSALGACDLLVWLVGALPALVILAVLIIVLLPLLRKWSRRSREKRAARKAAKAEKSGEN